jgi:O-antigen/teichoic acid export membrane protein
VMGIFFNLSIWYKLTNKTQYGAVLVLLGALITVIVNTLFIPRYGYIASAWAHLFCYSTMVVLSYLWSRKHYAVPYHTGRILAYIALAVSIYLLNELFLYDVKGPVELLRLLLLALFSMIVVWGEHRTFNKYKSG